MSAATTTTFAAELSLRVEEHLDEDVLRVAHGRLHRKALIVVAWFIASYVGVLLAGSWLWGAIACASLGLAIAGVGFNIQHDANHNALFATGGSKRMTVANRLAGLSIHVIGGDSKRWIDGHVRQHHAAPNVVGRDHDLELAPFARMAPSQRRRSWHALQHLYIWVVYAFTSTAIIVGDVVGIIQDSITGDRHGNRPSLRDYLVMVGSKSLFVVVMVAVPIWIHSWLPVLLGILGVLAISGLVLGVVFQLAHVVSEADFCSVEARSEARWHEWQVLASVDFCHGDGPVSRACTWYCGGLNYQTEHHLFPGLPHPAYPGIAPIVADTCAEFGIPYLVQPTLRAAVRSHYQHLRLLGQPTGPAAPRDAPLAVIVDPSGAARVDGSVSPTMGLPGGGQIGGVCHDEGVVLSTGLLLRRGLRRRCPVCGQNKLFRRWIGMVDACPRCGLHFERVPGQWLGSWFLNICLAQVLVIGIVLGGAIAAYPNPPLLLLGLVGGAVTVLFPIWFFPYSRMIWVAIDLAMRPLEWEEGVDPQWELGADTDALARERAGGSAPAADEGDSAPPSTDRR